MVLDKFVKHIRDYTATVLAFSDPAGIIMFGVSSSFYIFRNVYPWFCC